MVSWNQQILSLSLSHHFVKYHHRHPFLKKKTKTKPRVLLFLSLSLTSLFIKNVTWLDPCFPKIYIYKTTITTASTATTWSTSLFLLCLWFDKKRVLFRRQMEWNDESRQQQQQVWKDNGYKYLLRVKTWFITEQDCRHEHEAEKAWEVELRSSWCFIDWIYFLHPFRVILSLHLHSPSILIQNIKRWTWHPEYNWTEIHFDNK